MFPSENSSVHDPLKQILVYTYRPIFQINVAKKIPCFLQKDRNNAKKNLSASEKPVRGQHYWRACILVEMNTPGKMHMLAR